LLIFTEAESPPVDLLT